MTRKQPLLEDAEPALRLLRAARACRRRDLAQLSVLGELVRHVSELVHALQKERGASCIYLGSHGLQFAEALAARVADSQMLELRMRERFAHIDEQLDRLSSGARFYTRLALAFRALATLPETRSRIDALAAAPKDAVHAFSELIARLLAVSVEAADIGADADTSRALVALVNFAQGKEYAGQERAVAGGALSAGPLSPQDRAALKALVEAQARAFAAFRAFAPAPRVAAFEALAAGAESQALNTLRESTWDPATARTPPTPAQWYETSTRRIERLRELEDVLAADVPQRCAQLLAAAGDTAEGIESDAPRTDGTVGLLVNDHPDGPHWYSAELQPMKPLRAVIEAQSRHIDEINAQLQSARAALAERKLVEQAKGLLMRARRLSEKDAYTLLRQTAMSQNKRLCEVAELVIKAMTPTR